MTLLANVFFPYGNRDSMTAAALGQSLLAYLAKLVLLGGIVVVVETNQRQAAPLPRAGFCLAPPSCWPRWRCFPRSSSNEATLHLRRSHERERVDLLPQRAGPLAHARGYGMSSGRKR